MKSKLPPLKSGVKAVPRCRICAKQLTPGSDMRTESIVSPGMCRTCADRLAAGKER